MEDLLIPTPTKPPRKTEFIGNFEMEDFQIHYESRSGNSAFAVTTHPKVEFLFEKKPAKKELKISLGKFVEATMESAFYSRDIPIVAQQTEIDRGEPVRITEHGFVIQRFNGKILLSAENDTATLGFTCAAVGRATNGKLSMNFKIIIPGNIGDSISISGTGTGKKI